MLNVGDKIPQVNLPIQVDGEFRTLRKTCHDKNGAYQHRNGQQFVKVAWHEQRHVHQCVLNLVALKFVATQGLKLVNQVKKNKQR